MRKIKLLFSILNKSLQGKELTPQNYYQLFESIKEKEAFRYNDFFVEITKQSQQLDYKIKIGFFKHLFLTILVLIVSIFLILTSIYLFNYLFDVLKVNQIVCILLITFINIIAIGLLFSIKRISSFLGNYLLLKNNSEKLKEFNGLINKYNSQLK